MQQPDAGIQFIPDAELIGITAPKRGELPHLVTNIDVTPDAGLIGTIGPVHAVTLSSYWNESYT
jgi:hypothetical protein